MQVSEWMEEVRGAKSLPCYERLKIIAQGPDGRDDVEAARRVLKKREARANDQPT